MEECFPIEVPSVTNGIEKNGGFDLLMSASI